MKHPLKNTDGFTLLELMLSLGIVGFIIGISLGGIRLGISARDAGDRKTDTLQRLRFIGEELSQKITSSYPVFVSSAENTLSTTHPESRSRRVLAFEGEKDSIRFVTFSSALSSGGNSSWAHEVRFYLGKHPKTGERGIIMTERDVSDGDIFTSPSASADKAHYFLLAKDVSFMKFRYFQWEKTLINEPGAAGKSFTYSGKWVDRINFNPQLSFPVSKDSQAAANVELLTLPRGVEISLGLVEPADVEKDGKTRRVSSAPILVLLHSGMSFSLPVEAIS